MSRTLNQKQAPRRGRLIAAGLVLPALAALVWMRASAPVAEPAAQPTVAAQVAPAPQQAAPAVAAPAAVVASTKDDMKRTPAPVTSAADSAPAAAGQKAYIDPKTGRLRDAEHDDVLTAAPAPGAQRRALRTVQAQEGQEILGPGGAVGMTVPEDLQTYLVATRTPDGRVVMEHTTGPKAAAGKTRAGAKAAQSGAKEDRNDR